MRRFLCLSENAKILRRRICHRRKARLHIRLRYESTASAESSFGAGSLAGKFDKEFEKQNENSSANENEKDIEIAYGVLAENEEIKSLLESGMVIAYAGYTENIDGRECYVFVLGTDHEDHIVNEYFYGVCDNLIYVYDVLDDSWNAV